MKSEARTEQLPLFDQKGRPGYFPPPLIPIALPEGVKYNKGIQKLLKVSHSGTETTNKLARR